MMLLISAGVVGGWWLWPRNPGMPTQVVRDIAPLQTRLEYIVASSDAMTLTTLEAIPSEMGMLPIALLSYRPDIPEKYHILITGGVHGNEPAGTEAVIQFAEQLSQGKLKYPGVAFDLIPLVNPWGWIHHWRRNAQGRDLNREFNTFKAPEAVVMRDLLSRNTYDLMLDLHEDSHVPGFYLYRLANPNYESCRHIIETVRNAGYPIHDGWASKIFPVDNGIIHCALWSLQLARALHQLSITNYARLEGCPQSFVFETPRSRPLETRVAVHLTAVKAVLEKSSKNNVLKMDDRLLSIEETLEISRENKINEVIRAYHPKAWRGNPVARNIIYELCNDNDFSGNKSRMLGYIGIIGDESDIPRLLSFIPPENKMLSIKESEIVDGALDALARLSNHGYAEAGDVLAKMTQPDYWAERKVGL